MVAIAICALAFVVCYFAGKRSLGLGLAALMVFSFFYGILRANLLTTASHFIFDAGLMGLYLSSSWQSADLKDKKRLSALKIWLVLLIAWPVLIVFLPFQPFLISLVGLRGNIFFIPLLLLGSRLKRKDLLQLSVGLAVLDLFALGFAVAEYFVGVPRFYPLSPVTLIIYASGDVAGGFFRIPSIFVNAHAFGGTMVSTLPFLIGLWTSSTTRFCRILGLASIPAALIGVLMSATRVNFVVGAAMVAFILFTSKMKAMQRAFFVLLIVAIGAVALTNIRFQRFKTLSDTDAVAERVGGSVNRGFWEILAEYPMGNGLGGGGSSIPYFLEGQLRNPIGMENEYARILAEQGVIGLLIWIGFVIWFYSRARVAFAQAPWATTRRLTWCVAALGFGTAWMGIGLLTAIPQTLLLMIGTGWSIVPPVSEKILPANGVRVLPFNPDRSVYARTAQ